MVRGFTLVVFCYYIIDDVLCRLFFSVRLPFCFFFLFFFVGQHICVMSDSQDTCLMPDFHIVYLSVRLLFLMALFSIPMKRLSLFFT